MMLCRAGAMTVAELSAVGLPAAYVPLPIGNGEQRLNAQPVVKAGGGLLVDDAELTPEWVQRQGPARPRRPAPAVRNVPRRQPSSAAGTPTTCSSAWCTRRSPPAATAEGATERQEAKGHGRRTTTARRGEQAPAHLRPAPGRRPRPRRGPAARLRCGMRRPGRLAACGASSAAGAVWVLYGSSWLRVEQVSRTGHRGADRRAGAWSRGGVPVGAPLVSVDTDAIEDTGLRRKLPRIDSVDVVRSWPHGIGLKVTERTPGPAGAKRARSSSKWTLKACDSRRFPKPRKVCPHLELTLSRSGSPTASLRRFGSDRLVREAVRVAGDLPECPSPRTRQGGRGPVRTTPSRWS